MTDLCAGGVKLKPGKRCPVCDAGPGDQCAKASLRDFEERKALIKSLAQARNALRAVYHEIDNPAMPSCLAAAWETADLTLARVSGSGDGK